MKTTSKFNNEQLHKAFNEADSDKDGKIGAKTLKQTLSKLGHNIGDRELEAFLKKSGINIDTDPNVEINFGMFSSLVHKITREKEQEAQLKQAFEEFDGDRKGFIEGAGIKRVLTKLRIEHTSEEIELMMEVADTNGDGRVDIEEFLQIFQTGDFH